MIKSSGKALTADACPFAFDQHSQDYARNWPELTAELRSRDGLTWVDSYRGFWIASRYKDIVEAARNPGGFSTSRQVDPVTGEVRGGATIPVVTGFRGLPNGIDPPEWNAMRELLNPLFSPAAAESRREAAREIAAALIDEVIEQGAMDLVTDFTRKLPGMLTMDILGLPRPEWRRYAAPIHDLSKLDRHDPGFAKAALGFDAYRERVNLEVENRTCEPRDDLFMLLATAQLNGRPLTTVERQDIALNVLAGGVDTTTALTSGALLYLGRHPDEREALTANPALRPRAREEFARYISPIQGMARTVTQDLTIDGCPLHRGDRIFLAYASANRDERVFEAAGEMRLDRSPNPHVAFGAGTHRCLGIHFARMMFDVMIAEVLDRLPDFTIWEEGVVHYDTIGAVNGLAHVPIRFAPAARKAERPSWLHG